MQFIPQPASVFSQRQYLLSNPGIRILAAAITAMEKSAGRAALAPRHAQCGQGEGRVQAPGKGPSEDLAAVEIEHDGEEEPALMDTHDLHATILHLLSLDHEALTFNYAGRDFRLTNVSGKVARKILA